MPRRPIAEQYRQWLATDHSNDEAPALAGDLNGHLFEGEKLG
jgi:hypothetical protein